ncbi:MAG: thioredoxin family protein [Oscillospiraceae bacterium]|jgi:glutaredoxin|nr:thioredoxin family protein [Oscillospiraceae bacterium]
MQKILYFHFDSCPYCQQANRWLEDLLSENPQYRAIPITRIDERKEPILADQYDYYYVPTFYVGDRKVHEGAATREKVLSVLEQALAAADTIAG